MNDLKDSTTQAQERMIQQQVIERGITDPRVIDALRSIPRDHFFPPKGREFAYADRAAPIGFGQTISQPYMVALMTQRLELAREHTVLEIGTGSGYQTAVLARLAREVYSIERVKPLLDEAFDRVLDLNLKNVHFKHADGTQGWPDHAPYDRILITAGAPELPKQLLLNNLKDHGLAILPVGKYEDQVLTKVTRRGPELQTVDICGCRFVKLIGQEGWPE